jgi:hypothetical protein
MDNEQREKKRGENKKSQKIKGMEASTTEKKE